ncbi:glycosyltransferase family 4 protein [Pseudoalteromonas sp. BZB3]|uniref:glycosyltransferase family 4 protein n=1 Tax=Pseudoalteromonas sp. BZB3 TaxID=3136670 RepID=UPI0032C46B7B
MIVRLFNFSKVFGGQERYAENLVETLGKRGIQSQIFSDTTTLKEVIKSTSKDDVTILNGNAALYKFVFIKKKSFWVYVQHSDINDSQVSLWKIITRKFLIKLLLMRVDLVVRVCNRALPDFYAPNKIKTIYNGVHLPDRVHLSSISDGMVNLLMVGAVNHNKNQRLVLDALAHLRNCNLTIVGSGPDLGDLKEYAKQIGVSARVFWKGFETDIDKFYRQADLLLLLSFNEAFPYVVLESMSHGTPVLSVKVGGVPEILKHNSNGWLLEDYETQSLIDSVNHIISAPDNYVQVAKSARKTIEDNFTLDKVTNELIEHIFKE